MTERVWAIGLLVLCGCIEPRSPAADAPLEEQTPIACRIETDDGPLLIPSNLEFACGVLFRQMCGREPGAAHDQCYADHFEVRALITPVEACHRETIAQTVEALSEWGVEWQVEDACADIPTVGDNTHWPERQTLYPCDPTHALDFRLDLIEAIDNGLQIHFEAYVCESEEALTTCFRQTADGAIEIWPGYAWGPRECEAVSPIRRVHTIPGAFFEDRAWFFTGRLPRQTDFRVLARSQCATHLTQSACEAGECDWTGGSCETPWQAAQIVHR